ncbi:MAG: hypothetical protein CL859_04545 [Cyanobium sp. ARS6]|uniref:trimeric intracellular cation channel family protein n=1 Tax=unclassified Synechococcus TaxID=2626047 RepID=UPI000C4C5892|nr:hypothetical protein [Cyanobium sp. ARS6]
MQQTSILLEFLGTIAFAITAVLAGTEKRIDLLSACVFALVTAVGGGTIRDVIINQPVFWATSQFYIWVPILCAVIAFFWKKIFIRKRVNKLLLYMDAVGISVFAIQAFEKVWNLDYGTPLGPIILGVITAIGGGIMRDVMAGRSNLLLSKELYAIPILIGCVAYAFILNYAPGYSLYSGLFCMVLIFAIRCIAIEERLTVPKWLIST